ncbi:MAG: tetratricopeptide repeat protein, partial [Paracoccaceae bacterium]|nr:tetratricopeptide repeat protein [Paracoccaceae bacterium]
MTLSVDKSLVKARKHAKNGEFIEAEILYLAVLNRFPKNKRASDGLKSLNAMQGATISKPTDAQVQPLVTLYEQGNYTTLATQAHTLSKTYPKAGILYELQGAAYTGLSKLETALDMFKQAILCNPNSASAHNNLGNVLRQTGVFDKAIVSYSRATTLQPDFAMAHNNLGITYWHSGNPQAACKSYATAIKLQPDYADAHNNLGYALAEHGEIAAAVESYRTAIKHAPNFIEAHNNLGNVLQELGALEDAITSFQKALELAPGVATIHNNMGNAMQEKGDRPKAVESYSRATELDPGYQIARSQKLHQLSHICDWEKIAIDLPLLPSLGMSDQEVDPLQPLREGGLPSAPASPPRPTAMISNVWFAPP